MLAFRNAMSVGWSRLDTTHYTALWLRVYRHLFSLAGLRQSHLDHKMVSSFFSLSSLFDSCTVLSLLYWLKGVGEAKHLCHSLTD